MPICKVYCGKKDKIKAGDLVGKMGVSGASSAIHLHFEVLICTWKDFWTKTSNGIRKYAVDGYEYIKEFINKPKEQDFTYQEAYLYVKDYIKFSDEAMIYLQGYRY